MDVPPITAGRHLAALPVDARTGKLLVVGAVLGCLAPALSIAAAASHKSPFSAPFDQQDAAQRARAALAAPGAAPPPPPPPPPMPPPGILLLSGSCSFS